jgi:hypothetical protein
MIDDYYIEISNVVSVICHRFSKQLYACVPLVTSTLHSLLGHLIRTDMSEAQVVSRGTALARIVESLVAHRDVYKKHVLGLVVTYLVAVQDDLIAVKKRYLLPSIYWLLDILGSHEIKQLMSLLDARGRSNYRTIQQSYQKFHVYKGQ